MCKNKTFMFSMGVIAGVVGGIVAGVLFAPKSGEESRKDLKDAVTDFYDKHAPQICEAKKQALESVDRVKYKLEKQFKNLNESVKSKKMQKAKELEDSESSAENEFEY